VAGANGQEYRWRVPRKVPVGKLVVGATVAGLAVLSATEPWQWATVAVVVAGFAAWAVRDLAAPVRLAADPAGVSVVTGFAARRRLGWSQVERVRVDARRRSRLLEVDTGERLYLFSRYEVDADLDEVAERLEALRRESHGMA
jgi:hypothetical protein